MTQLRIPAHLLPADGRFGCGPSAVPQAALQAVASSLLMGTSHRQPPVKSLVGRVREGLRELFDLPDGYVVTLGNGGATQFWDIATCSLIERRSAHGVYGEFTRKFADATARAPHLAAPVVSTAPAGSVGLPHQIADVDVYAWAHNETSTGACAPVHRIDGGLVVIDATSAAGAMPVTITDTDVYYFAPQKAFAADGGLWFAVLSPAAIERIHDIASTSRWIPDTLSLQLALANSVKNQTLNTPALATFVLMDHQLTQLLEAGGLAAAARRSATSSAVLYDWAASHELARPFVTEQQYRSPVVVTIDFDDTVDAAEIARTLRANGIVDVEPYRKLNRNQLRIATFPAIDPADVAALTACIDWVLGHQVR